MALLAWAHSASEPGSRLAQGFPLPALPPLLHAGAASPGGFPQPPAHLQMAVGPAAPLAASAPVLEALNADSSETIAPKSAPAREAGDRAVAGDDATRPRCHLHKRPQASCRFCQRHAPPKATKEVVSQVKRAIKNSKKTTFNCGPMLREQVLMSTYYKSLTAIQTVDEFVDEAHRYATDGIDVYRPGSSLEPSCFMCCVYRLFTLEHNDEELQAILDNPHSPIVRCIGFLFVRFVAPPDELWELLEDFLLDDASLKFASGKEGTTTIGEYVEGLLLKEKYFNTPLPRIPVVLKKKMEAHIAPLQQCRKRALATARVFGTARGNGVPVEVCVAGQWRNAIVQEVVRRVPSRLRVRVRLEDGGEEIVAHIGRVVFRGPSPTRDESRSRSRSRSRGRRRGRSPDWSRYKGKSDEALIEELRDKARAEAVCDHRKAYAKRPPRFDAGLALKREHGSAEARLIEEETFVAPERSRRRNAAGDEDEMEQTTPRRRAEEDERQKKLKDIFEKYGQQRAWTSTASRANEIEGPDTMRLG